MEPSLVLGPTFICFSQWVMDALSCSVYLEGEELAEKPSSSKDTVPINGHYHCFLTSFSLKFPPHIYAHMIYTYIHIYTWTYIYFFYFLDVRMLPSSIAVFSKRKLDLIFLPLVLSFLFVLILLSFILFSII